MLLPVAAAQAQNVWYWYYSTSTGGCWNTVQFPSDGPPSYACDSVGPAYLPAANINGQNVQTYINDGAFGDVGGQATHSGDYCNAYSLPTFTSYLGDAYFWGDPGTGSFCYADGPVWQQNVNNQGSGGAQHFASVQGDVVLPWFFGRNPELYIYNQFSQPTNTSTSAWAYVCADLKDLGGNGDILEICANEWDYNKQNPNVVGCANINNIPLALPEDYYEPTGQHFTTMWPGSNKTTTGQTVPSTKSFAMAITTTDLTNAINSANRFCSAWGSWSPYITGYRLMGIENGEEFGLNAGGEIKGTVQNLQFATLYN